MTRRELIALMAAAGSTVAWAKPTMRSVQVRGAHGSPMPAPATASQSLEVRGAQTGPTPSPAIAPPTELPATGTDVATTAIAGGLAAALGWRLRRLTTRRTA